MTAALTFIRAYWSQALFLGLGVLLGCSIASLIGNERVATAHAELAGLRAQHSDALAKDRSAALERLQLANQRADHLQVALDRSEQRLTTTQTEIQREIKKRTTGRACLDGGTVRLLSAQAAGSQATTVPTPTGQPVADDAAVATDTDVASWASVAITQYDICRARLDALIAWHLPPTTENESPHD